MFRFSFSGTRNIIFRTLKIGQNDPEIPNLEFESHGFLENQVYLPTEQAETNICWIIYQDASFKTCLSLFGDYFWGRECARFLVDSYPPTAATWWVREFCSHGFWQTIATTFLCWSSAAESLQSLQAVLSTTWALSNYVISLFGHLARSHLAPCNQDASLVEHARVKHSRRLHVVQSYLRIIKGAPHTSKLDIFANGLWTLSRNKQQTSPTLQSCCQKPEPALHPWRHHVQGKLPSYEEAVLVYSDLLGKFSNYCTSMTTKHEP